MTDDGPASGGHDHIDDAQHPDGGAQGRPRRRSSRAAAGGLALGVALGVAVPVAVVALSVAILGHLPAPTSGPSRSVTATVLTPFAWAVSWLLLRWHQLLAAVLPAGGQTGTTDLDWVLAIAGLVATVRALLFPFFLRQTRAQRTVAALAPHIQDLQRRYQGEQLRVEMVKLYRSARVNPLMGCAALLVQAVVFLSIYQMLRMLSPEVTTAAYGWSLAQLRDASGSLFLGVPLDERYDAVSHLAVHGTLVALWMVLIYMNMYLAARKVGAAAGGTPRILPYGLPIVALLASLFLPLGVVLYSVLQTLVGLALQAWALRRVPMPTPSAPDPWFGFPFALAFATIAMLAFPIAMSVS